MLVLTKTTAMGGAERLLINALPHLNRDSFDYAFAACDGHGPLAEACRAHGLPFATLPCAAPLDPRNARALRGRLRDEGVALLHAHLPLVGTLARCAARGLATRVVYTEHNTPEGYRRPSRWLNRVTWRWQEAAVAVSAEVARRAPRRGAGPPPTVVENGLDFAALDAAAAAAADPPPPEPPGALRVLVPGTLARRKGQDVLLDALAGERGRALPPLVVWLAGGGPARGRLARRARDPRLAGRVHLLGPRRDVHALMARADLVLLPSRTEGHPLALLEALALGRPCLASAVGGVPEIVRPGLTGRLVAPDDPEALARALAELLADPAGRARLGAAAARDARARFDVRRTVAALEAVYRDALVGASHPIA